MNASTRERASEITALFTDLYELTMLGAYSLRGMDASATFSGDVSRNAGTIGPTSRPTGAELSSVFCRSAFGDECAVERQLPEQRLRLGDLGHLWRRRKAFEGQRQSGVAFGSTTGRLVELREL